MFEELEKWRIACAEWLDLQEAADLLTDTKKETFAEIASKIDAKSEAEKSRLALLSQDWKQHNRAIIEANSKARRAKMREKYADTRFAAVRSMNANARAELHKAKST